MNSAEFIQATVEESSRLNALVNALVALDIDLLEIYTQPERRFFWREEDDGPDWSNYVSGLRTACDAFDYALTTGKGIVARHRKPEGRT